MCRLTTSQCTHTHTHNTHKCTCVLGNHTTATPNKLFTALALFLWARSLARLLLHSTSLVNTQGQWAITRDHSMQFTHTLSSPGHDRHSILIRRWASHAGLSSAEMMQHYLWHLVLSVWCRVTRNQPNVGVKGSFTWPLWIEMGKHDNSHAKAIIG